MEEEVNDRHVPLDNWFDDDDNLPSAANENDNNFNNNADHMDVIAEENTSLKGRYVKSVALVIAVVNKLFTRSVWSGRPIATHPLANHIEIDALLQVLRKSSPLIRDQLKIDSSNIKKHLDIQKVLENHTRGGAYIRQFSKRPLLAP